MGSQRGARADWLRIGQSGRMAAQREFVPLTVRIDDGRTEMWELTVESDPHVSCRTLLMAADGTQWRADGADIFECLLILRNQVEPYGFRLCCNASRRDAWVSGMLRDMGDGTLVYLLTTRPPDGSGGPETADTLGAAPPDEVVSLPEQLDWVAEHLQWGDKRPDWVLRAE